MTKKDNNLMKFWASLESNNQNIKTSQNIMKPFRPYSSLKNLNSEVKPYSVSHFNVGKNDENVCEKSTDPGEFPDSSLPLLPRNDILPQPTKSRIRRNKNQSTRQRKLPR